MGLKSDLDDAVDGILSQTWNTRDGMVVPSTADIALAGGAVRLTAVMLYADLADSTLLAATYDRRIAAKVYKAFLACASKIIKDHDGAIRSFDGDRVMAVFLGTTPNTNAVKAALKLNWAVDSIIRPKLEAKYDVIKCGDYKISHGVGIDVSEVLVVRGGVRNDNDLLWIGRAPNVAAKLCALRGSYRTFITAAVYAKLADEAKTSKDGKAMWTQQAWTAPGGVEKIYKSNWGWVIN
ncbi:MAG: adenylate/guanylate cyclase domain-containing protein [Methanoregulaceae archaeon]|nr:adenylate/guanylate cyclase domain-containing protein [Methanoregulaceae archaeon]